MHFKKERKAFSMITAIFIIVLMSSVAAFIANISGKMVKETTAQYHREQSVLLAKSYTEYAIMAVTANEHNLSTCLNDISGNYGIYNITVNISYIAQAGLLHTNCRRLDETVLAPKSPLNIIVDVFVKYKDSDHPLGALGPNISYHRRSLQKI